MPGIIVMRLTPFCPEAVAALLPTITKQTPAGEETVEALYARLCDRFDYLEVKESYYRLLAA